MKMTTLKMLLSIFVLCHIESFLLQVCDGEVLYVTPTPPPNSSCPDGLPCHTLHNYFTNNSLLEQKHDLTMIFLSGHHEGFCQKTTIQATSFNATGIDAGVTVNCTNIELTHAATVCFESIILDHWYISCPYSTATLGFYMSSVAAQNQTQVYIEHARKVQGNFVVLNNSVFTNSSLFGTLHFGESRYHKVGVMNLVSSKLTLDKNTSITFDYNIVQHGAMHLNSSTLNAKNVHMSFSNNQRAMLLNKSTLNIVNSSVTFVGNSARPTEQGGALFAFNSTVNAVNSTEVSFLNNWAQAGGAVYLKLSTLHFSNRTKVIFKNNSATAASDIVAQLSSVKCVTVGKQMNVNFKIVGGALAMTFSTLVIRHHTRITFTDNLSDMLGGAVDVRSHSTMIVESNITFINNSAGYVGGAMNINISTLTVSSHATVDFINSYSGYQSGGLAVQKSTINVQNNSKILFNNSTGYVAGAMSLLASDLNVKHNATMTFINNFARNQTGAIDAQNSTTIKIENYSAVTFINNSGKARVGAVNLEFESTLNIGYGARVLFAKNSGRLGSTALNLNRASKLNVTFGASLTFFNNGHKDNPFAGALVLFQHCILHIENGSRVVFRNNSASSGGAVVTMLSSIFMDSGATVTFMKNSAVTSGGAAYITLSDISIGRDANLTFINNSAKKAGGGMLLLSSKLIVKDNVNMTFIGNSATRGGAIALLSTQMTFRSADSPNMTFIHNSAGMYGGAIYVNPDRLEPEYEYIIYSNYVRCFYYIDSDTESTVGTRYSFYFSNNSAWIGYDIYGASLELCKGSIKHFESDTGLSSISGHPTRVCRCTDHLQPQCDDPCIIHKHNIHPSETLTIPVVIVGGDWGATTGIVYASFRQPNISSVALGPDSQYTQYINTTKCTMLSYTVYSKQSVQLTLSAFRYHDVYSACINNGNYDPNVCQHFSPLTIHLNVLPCPPGFSQQGNPPGCDCYSMLSDNGVKCNIKSGTLLFSWSTALWMSIEKNDTIYSENCPFDYCSEEKSMKNNNSDVQCAFNRAGRLCGSCKQNYSLAIGSSRCIFCSSSNNLALLIYFAIAGLLLIVFVGVLNLTVTQGMINGLIFYANIVWTYQSILFPAKKHGKLFFFKTFIAWLNLDFGIETCFIKGLNAFLKTWLQFVFPLYIWTIAGLMIVLARYSTRVTKFFGERAVPILATIILLSYNKLLKTAVGILDFSVISVYSEWNVTKPAMTVWAVNGTFEYFRYPHIVLFVAALFTLMVLWLPYTLLLLLIQWLRRISHLRILKWITRFEPFYDAYFAPLKPNHQYWFGVLLLARGMILVTFASNFALPENVSLLLLLVSAGLLLFYSLLRNLYKSHVVMTFESSLLLNLCLLSGGMLFAHTKRKFKPTIQATAVGLSTGIAFFQACFVIAYQIYFTCFSRVRGKGMSEVQVNEEQAHAILDISAQLKNPGEIQPLLVPPQSDSDVPTY